MWRVVSCDYGFNFNVSTFPVDSDKLDAKWNPHVQQREQVILGGRGTFVRVLPDDRWPCCRVWQLHYLRAEEFLPNVFMRRVSRTL